MHGQRALDRARSDDDLFRTINIQPGTPMAASRARSAWGRCRSSPRPQHAKPGTTTTASHSRASSYIRREWSRSCTVERIVTGAIHDFQDIVVLKKKWPRWRLALTRIRQSVRW